MISYMPAIGHQEPSERFFFVEKPRFDITVMAGFENKLEGEPKGAMSSDNNTTM